MNNNPGHGRDQGGHMILTYDHPRWPEFARTRATEVCAQGAGERRLIGWVTDDSLAEGRSNRLRRDGIGASVPGRG